MATVTYIRESKQSISAMKGVIDYCCQDKKVYDEISNQRLVSGVNCDGENAFKEFMAIKKSYGKTDGMNFYQYVQSFSPEENITPQKAHEVALEFAEKAWTGYEVLVATHCDAQHIHSHFVINSVSFENGKKLRQNPNTLKSLRALSDEICQHHNLSTLEPYSKDGMKISTREYRTAVKGQSWKFKLMNDIDKAMNISGSKEDFINAMSIMGYLVTLTDDRKYITYQCPNKMKCRDIKLHNEKYLKGKAIYRIPDDRYNKKLSELTDALGLNSFMKYRVDQLSLGQRMRAEIAVVLLYEPELLILDEPFIGVDLIAKESIRQILQKMSKDKNTTIILTTHNVEEIEKICERVILLDKGSMVFNGSFDRIKYSHASINSLSAELTDKIADMQDLPVTKYTIENKKITLWYDSKVISTKDLTAYILSQCKVKDLLIRKPTVEEIIRNIYEEDSE